MVQGILAAIPSLYQTITGMAQAAQGRRTLDGLERPTYEIPGAAKQSLALAQAQYADPRMPGENTANSRIAQAFSNFNSAARQTSNPLAGLAMAQANANRGYTDVAAQSAMYQRQDQQNLQQQQGQYAQYQDQAWQMNKFAPYFEKYNEAREQIGAGQQNQFSGMNGLASIAMQMLAPQKPVDQFAVRAATSDANAAQQQDSFITSAGKLIGNATQQGFQQLGLSPSQLYSLVQGINKM